MCHSSERIHGCMLCESRFKLKHHLNRHINMHLGEKPSETCSRPSLENVSKCSLCSKSFTNNSDYKRHAAIHITSDKSFGCRDCNAIFRSKQGLWCHMECHRQPHRGSLECIFCHAKCGHKDQLDKHLLSHIRESPNFCKFCPAELRSKHGLQNHTEIHNPSRSKKGRKERKENREREEWGRDFHCRVCSKSFFTNPTLVQHLRIHTDQNYIFKCDICDKYSTTSRNLERHRKTVHFGERDHPCMICQIKCSSKVALEEHMRHHTGEHPFRCDVCKMLFTRLSSHRKHQQLCRKKRGIVNSGINLLIILVDHDEDSWMRVKPQEVTRTKVIQDAASNKKI